MNDEIFDVVDQDDNVIDQRSRAEVHRLNLKHRAVHVLVFNRAGNVFLQKRSMSKDQFPGAWDSSAAGHLEAGEDYDSCAARELREELGLSPHHPPQPLFKIPACNATGHEHVWVYRAEAEGPFQLHPDEIERGDWFAPDHVTGWIHRHPDQFASGFRLLWSRLQSVP